MMNTELQFAKGCRRPALNSLTQRPDQTLTETTERLSNPAKQELQQKPHSPGYRPVLAQPMKRLLTLTQRGCLAQ